jgi:hypothetical protein
MHTTLLTLKKELDAIWEALGRNPEPLFLELMNHPQTRRGADAEPAKLTSQNIINYHISHQNQEVSRMLLAAGSIFTQLLQLNDRNLAICRNTQHIHRRKNTTPPVTESPVAELPGQATDGPSIESYRGDKTAIVEWELPGVTYVPS